MVTRIDETLRTTVREMFRLMYQARGIGLAANQVGLPFRFFVLNLEADPEETAEERVYLNPEILRSDALTREDEEGCLSFPGLYGNVKRPTKIRVRAMDLSGKVFEHDATDLLGRAIQHESDHLAGKLFIDYFDEPTRAMAAPAIAETEAGFRAEQAAGKYPADDEIRRLLDEMVKTNRILLPTPGTA
jgi:peptide deformylase